MSLNAVSLQFDFKQNEKKNNDVTQGTELILCHEMLKGDIVGGWRHKNDVTHGTDRRV